jgi:hypothetical protein
VTMRILVRTSLLNNIKKALVDATNGQIKFD